LEEAIELPINDTTLSNLNDKKLKKIIALMKTDNKCFATYNQIRLKTESGLLSVKSLNNCQLS
jgi:hypothetical protein